MTLAPRPRWWGRTNMPLDIRAHPHYRMATGAKEANMQYLAGRFYFYFGYYYFYAGLPAVC